MEPINVASAKVPILFIPIKCTSPETNRKCNIHNKSVKLNLSVTTPGPDGASLSVYSGPCCVQSASDIMITYQDDIAKVKQEITTDSSNCDDSNKMPVKSPDVPTSTTTTNSNFSDQPYQSQVRKDPSGSPYVYNRNDRPVQKKYAVLNSRISVQQHNTYITRNVITYGQTQNDPEQGGYKRMRETPKWLLCTEIFNEDEESESEMSQVSKKKNKGDHIASTPTQGDNEGDVALKQCSSKPRSSKAKLDPGENSETGQTIQDPKVKCSAATMDNDPPTYGGIRHQLE